MPPGLILRGTHSLGVREAKGNDVDRELILDVQWWLFLCFLGGFPKINQPSNGVYFFCGQPLFDFDPRCCEPFGEQAAQNVCVARCTILQL